MFRIFQLKLKSVKLLRRDYSIVLLIVLINELIQTLVEGGGDLGSIRCLNGKWQVDTKIMSMVIICPIEISWDTVECALKRFGLYDEENGVNVDFHIYLCSLFEDISLVNHCREAFELCLIGSGQLYRLEGIRGN